MQFDKTQIVVRERGVLETFDLALHVVRMHFKPLAGLGALMIVPLMLINALMTNWMLADVSQITTDDGEAIARYLWLNCLLLWIEAPLASVFTTAYLGQAVFDERPRLRDVVRDVIRLSPRLAWCLLIERGIAAAFVLPWLIDRQDSFNVLIEILGLGFVAMFSAAVRAFRPFVMEIVLLERNPLTSRQPTTMTVGKRSAMLHGSGDVFGVWLLSLLVGGWFWLAGLTSLYIVQGVLQNDYLPPKLFLTVAVPLAFWLAQIFLGVARFLMYLGTRIHQEGWEVELRLRAESNRLANWLW